jgi:hypothetical protein
LGVKTNVTAGYCVQYVATHGGKPFKSIENRTAAASVIGNIRKICGESTDDSLKRAARALIPKNQLHRFE